MQYFYLYWIMFRPQRLNSSAIPPANQSTVAALAQVEREKVFQWIIELASPESRENALLELRY